MFEEGKKYKSRVTRTYNKDTVLADKIYTLVNMRGPYGDWKDSEGGFHRGWNMSLCFDPTPIEEEKKVKCEMCAEEKTDMTVRKCHVGDGKCVVCHECEEATISRKNIYSGCIECISKSRMGTVKEDLTAVQKEIEKKDINVFQKIADGKVIVETPVKFTIPEKYCAMEYIEPKSMKKK